ncbi:MAG TPA: hypothetical protein VH933_16885 [Aestuariivirgaceae bacterium]|jgi:hypothetical protein
MFSRVVLAALVLLFASLPSHAAQRLSAAQISALAPGNYVGTWKGKRQLNLRLSSNGVVSGTVDGIHHSGRWYVSDGNLCLEFKIIIIKKTKCGEIRREGRWLVGYYKKGKPRIRLRAVSSSKV